MKEIKFRYVLKGKIDKKIHYKWYYLNQIEEGLHKLFDLDNYEIIARNQYICLKDNDNIEIYEEDIVKVIDEFENISKHKVEYKAYEDYPAFDLEPPVDDIETNGLSYAIIDGIIQVIGNIYENSELLKEF